MKKVVIALMLVVVLAMAMVVPVLADKPGSDGHAHGDGGGGGGKDWYEWCHHHSMMGHTDHESWITRCSEFSDLDVHEW